MDSQPFQREPPQRNDASPWGRGRSEPLPNQSSRPSSDGPAWQQVGVRSSPPQQQRHKPNSDPDQQQKQQQKQQQHHQQQPKSSGKEVTEQPKQKISPEPPRSTGKPVSNKNNLPTPASQKKKSANKKQSKTKPTLQTMCIGDMISLPASLDQTAVKATNIKREPASSAQQSAQPPVNVTSLDSQTEFPALGSPAPVASSPAVAQRTGPSGVTANKARLPAWGPTAPMVTKNQLATTSKSSNTPKPSPTIGSSLNNAKNKGESKQAGQMRVLQRGELLPGPATKGKKKNAQPSQESIPTAIVTPNKKGNHDKNNQSVKAEISTKSNQDAAVFRWGDGDEHQLMRIMMKQQQQHGGDQGRNKGVVLSKDAASMLFTKKKGRQRLTPRKKKFTALKKKVLLERLNQWKELHPEYENAKDVGGAKSASEQVNVVSQTAATSKYPPTSTPSEVVSVYGFIASMEELLDDDEYLEIATNLREMAMKVGPIDDMYVPRQICKKGDSLEAADGGIKQEEQTNPPAVSKELEITDKLFAPNDPTKIPVLVKFISASDAKAAHACWNGLVIGGDSLQVNYVPRDSDSQQAGGGETSESPPSIPRWAVEALEKVCSEEVVGGSSHAQGGACTVVLQNVLTEDDYSDSDCMEESLNDIAELVKKYGNVTDVRPTDKDEISAKGSVEVTYIDLAEDLRNGGIITQLSREVLGGAPLVVRMVQVRRHSDDLPQKREASATPSDVADVIVLLRNALTDDDMEDNECLEESLKDIRDLAARHGEVSKISVQPETRLVEIHYAGGNTEVARLAAQNLSGLRLGGMMLEAFLTHSDSSRDDDQPVFSIYLYNLLTEDDMEDEDCLEETLNDAQELGSRFGEVIRATAIKSSSENEPGVVELQYKGPQNVAETAASEFNGMVLGGQIISATLQPNSATTEAPGITTIGSQTAQTDKREVPEGALASIAKKARTDDLPPLYSGDKLISERFAECKRVPKIPNPGTPRDYANILSDDRVKPLLVEMLGELMRLQKRAVEDKNAKARRRLVMGLREVARGIRAHKVKMVVMANNLDEYGVIDQKLQEIIDLAKNESVPLFFEFTKRTLGKAVGKSIKVAVVGIQNADGAHQPFKKLTAIANKM